MSHKILAGFGVIAAVFCSNIEAANLERSPIKSDSGKEVDSKKVQKSNSTKKKIGKKIKEGGEKASDQESQIEKEDATRVDKESQKEFFDGLNEEEFRFRRHGEGKGPRFEGKGPGFRGRGHGDFPPPPFGGPHHRWPGPAEIHGQKIKQLEENYEKLASRVKLLEDKVLGSKK